MRAYYFLILAACLLLAASAQAQNFTGATDSDMSDITNWDAGAFTNTADPDSQGGWIGFDAPTIVSGDSDIVTNDEATLQNAKFAANAAGGFIIGSGTPSIPTTVTLNEAVGETTRLWTPGPLTIGTGYSSEASLVVNGGEATFDNTGAALQQIPANMHGNYLLEVTGGTVNLNGTGRILLWPRSGTSEIRVSGGTLNLGADLEGYGTNAGSRAELNVSGGTVNIAGGYMDRISQLGDSFLNLSCGTINAEAMGAIVPYNANYQQLTGFDWSGGTIRIDPAGTTQPFFWVNPVTVSSGGPKRLILDSSSADFMDTRGDFVLNDTLEVENQSAQLIWLRGGPGISGTGGIDLLDGLFQTDFAYAAAELRVRNGAHYVHNVNDGFTGVTSATVDSGGLMDLRGSLQRLGGLWGDGTVQGQGSLPLYVGRGGQSSTFVGTLTGIGSLTVSPDAGTPARFELGGTNSYTGNTVINPNGTLALATDNGVSAATAGIYIQDNAFFDLNGFSDSGTNSIIMQKAGSKIVNSDSATAGSTSRDLALGAFNNLEIGGAGDLTVSGTMTGGAGGVILNKTGAGKATLAGGSTAVTSLRVLEGELELSSDGDYSDSPSYIGLGVNGSQTLTVSNDAVTTFATLSAQTESSSGVAGQAVLNVSTATLTVLGNLQGNARYADPTTATFTVNVDGGLLDISGGFGDRNVAGYEGTTHLNMNNGTLRAESVGPIFSNGNYGALTSIDWSGGDIVLAGPAAGGGSYLWATTATLHAGTTKTLIIDPVTSGSVSILGMQLDDDLAIANYSSINSYAVFSGTLAGSGGLELLAGRTQLNQAYSAGDIMIRNGAELRTGNSSVLFEGPAGVQVDAGGLLELRTGQSQIIGALSGAGDVIIPAGSFLYANNFGAESQFDGNITGAGNLSIGYIAASSGKLTLTGSNDYEGDTVVRPAAELVLASDSAVASNTIYIQDNATLDMAGITDSWTAEIVLQKVGSTLKNSTPTLTSTARALRAAVDSTNVETVGDLSIGGTLGFNNAAYTITKSGSGTLTLAGGDDSAGNIAVSDGTLDAASDLESLGVSIASGATLTGPGALASATVSGTHMPGASPVVQTIGDAAYNSGAVLEIELLTNSVGSAGTDYDQVVVTGSLNVSGSAKVRVVANAGGSAVDFTDAFWETDHSWVIVDAQGTSSGGFAYFAEGTVDSLGQDRTVTGGGFTTEVVNGDMVLRWNADLPTAVEQDWKLYR